MWETGIKELTAVFCDVFPDYVGNRATTSIKAGDGVHKIEYTLPVPSNDTEAKEIYNLTIHDLVAQGVKNVAYRVSGAVAKIKAATDVTDFDFLTDLANTIKSELFITPRVGGAKAQVNKEKVQAADELMKVFGVSSIEELMEKAKRMEEAKRMEAAKK